jgi:transcriptional regulator with XRE-family HTH domain
LLGVNVNTVVGWEIGRAEPKVSYVPRILEFLGYNPFPQAQSFGQRLRIARHRRGLTQVKLAQELHTSQSMVSLLEIGGEVTNARVLAVVQRFVKETEGV